MTTHQCDLVMKGGITSGVIYPRLVAKLSEVYRFRSIGGTSAGAIAAGAAAAAQLGVTTGANPNAFAQLDRLPEQLGGPANNASGSMLLNLFQPQPRFRRHFALLTSALNARSKTLTGVAVAWAAVWRFPLGALLGALPGALVAWYALGVARWIGVAFAIIGLVVGAAVAAVRSLARHLPRNEFGMCNGMADESAKSDVLSKWLHGYLNSLAGKTGDDPLTFGELWAAKLRAPGAPAPHDGKGEKEIELAMITTALNTGRPLRFPFEARDLYFKPDELGKFLPKSVIAWMVSHARDSDIARTLSAGEEKYFALPAPEDMPVLLGVRMSLSFPILLSAVPLYTIDWTRECNADGVTKAARVLFSDGGICSNFPVHFFDGPLPSRPTFGVNLKPFHPDHPDPDKDRVYLPPPLENNKGLKTFIPDLPAEPGLGSVFKFLGSIVNTMQNWRDQVQIGMPGYRDRIVHVCHTDKEGGINLNMEEKIIEALAGGGALAADELREAFLPGEDLTAGSWYNHRRIRMRTLLAGIDQKLRGIQRALGRADSPTWAEIVADSESKAYKFESQEHRALAIEILRDLAALGDKLAKSGIDLATGAPRPESEWRPTPRV
jgi:predicted acylesterase/phospholipase RssA